MDILTLVAFLIALGYNIYLADKMANSSDRRFEVKLTLGIFHPLRKHRIQKFVDENQDEFQEKLSRDMVNIFAGVDINAPVGDKYNGYSTINSEGVAGIKIRDHKGVTLFSYNKQAEASFLGVDKGSKKGDFSTRTEFTYSDEVNKMVDDLRKASGYYLSMGDRATANFYTKKVGDVIANAVPMIIISGSVQEQEATFDRIIPDLENQKRFEQLYMGHPYEQPEDEKRAFNALMAYEKNCFIFYDRPGKPSLTPRRGERIQDYALEYETTAEEMKKQRNAVEDQLKREGYSDEKR